MGLEMAVGPPRVRGGPTVHVKVRRCPTLPHSPECSTIGAGGLSFRVRNETGRFPSAMTTETLDQQNHEPTRQPQHQPSKPGPCCWGWLFVCCESHSGRKSIKHGVVKPSAY